MSKREKKVIEVESETEKDICIVKAFPKNEEQRLGFKTIDEKVVTILEGTAGVGKSHVAIAYGLQMLLRGKYDKIVLTRPIVTAGEDLGHLPGDIDEKTGIYLLPMFDILHKYLKQDMIERLFKSGKIVSLPLAYMRGYTMENAYCVLDEAQNATLKQLHLFLTRIGDNAKVVVTGDTSQTDIKNSGLADLIGILDGANDIGLVHFTEQSVVRHPVIVEIDKRIKNFKIKSY